MAIEYSIQISKECLTDSAVHESIKKISPCNPHIIYLDKGFVVHNTQEEIGFGYSLFDTKHQLWGYESDFFKEPFKYEQEVGFRLSKEFDYDDAIKNLFIIFFDLSMKINCNLILLSGDSIVLFRKNNNFFSTKENIIWLKDVINIEIEKLEKQI